MERFYRRIRQDISNIPSFLLTDVLTDVLQTFCRKTWLLSTIAQVQTADVATATNNRFDVDTTAIMSGDVAPIALYGLTLDGEAYLVDERSMADGVDMTDYLTERLKFYALLTDTVRIYPFAEDVVFTAGFVFATTDDVSTLPDTLVDWKHEICSGVLAELYARPKKKWSDPTLAMYHKAEFQKGINRAKTKWFRNNTGNALMGRRFI